MKKAIASKYTESIIVIERADWSIDFYDVETGRHYTRRVWYPVHGSDIFVQHRGGFYTIMTEYKGKYDPQAISRYETVSADELKSMTAEIIARRAGKQHADELTWEETTRVYAYAIVCNDADTEATMTAVVNDILQNRAEQPEPTEAAAADMPEPIIYATERTEATEPAPFEAEVQEWETLLIQIEENELIDTRTGESYTDGYRYTLYTVSKFGNLSTHYGLSSSGKTLESCKRAADRMLKKYFNRRTGDIVATGATLEAMHASATDETVHERFKVWAAGLFPAEQDERAAVEAIAADMLEEYGNAEDATNATAYGVFSDMHDGARPDDLEPADVEQMDRLMTYAAEAIARIQQTGEHVGDPLAKYRSVEYLEFDAPRPTYQRAELLAYLGEPDDYDVTAIEHDATAYDPATGRTVWAVDAETLAVIAERHQLQFYAPAF